VLGRGQQVVIPGTLRTSQILTAELILLDGVAPLKDHARVRLHHFSAELLASVRILDESGASIGPGATAFVQFRTESPVAALRGDRFVVRRYSPASTIGGGTILDPHLGKMSRGTRPELLETLRAGSMGERLELLARLNGLKGISLSALQYRTGLRGREILRLLHEEPAANVIEAEHGARWLHVAVLADFRRRSMEFLERYFEQNRMSVGLPKGELVQKLLPANADSALVNFLLQDLGRQKIATIAGDLVDIPGRSRNLGGAEGDLARIIEERFAAAELKPPPVSELIHTIAQKPKVIEGVISYLVKTNVLVRLADGLFLHRNTVATALQHLQTRQGETVDVGAFKDFFGLSRKVAIPLLEYFDRTGATRRVGDQRQIL